MPKTQIALTVGTNPLPVYVASSHLVKHFRNAGASDIGVSLILSAETRDYEQPLKKLLRRDNADLAVTTIHVPDAGNPKDIVARCQDGFGNLTDTHVHLHYTGGTKAFAVHAWEAARSFPGSSASYLDARGRRGPCIIDNEGVVLVPDCRKDIHLGMDDLLEMHGYEPITLKEPPAACGEELFKILLPPESWKIYSQWYEQYWKQGTPEGDCPGPDLSGWPALCPALNAEMEARNSAIRCDGDTGVVTGVTKKNRKMLADLLFGKFLECAVYHIANRELCAIANHGGPDNFRIRHSVKPLRSDVDAELQKDFELDVVLLLGYQLVVVSCTTEDREDVIKLKAMEAQHRAQQIGGEEARTLVVCGAHVDVKNRLVSKKIKEELYLDSGRGRDSGSMEIYGRESWPRLEQEINKYLKALHWQGGA